MAATDAFDDAALNADLGSILGLSADRAVPTGRSRSSVNLSQYKAHAILFLVTVLMLMSIGTLRFNQPEGSRDGADMPPATAVPTSRPVTPGTSLKFVAAPVMKDDALVVSTTPDVVAPPVATSRRQSLTKVASVVRPSSPTADVPAGTGTVPIADDDISQGEVETPSPERLSVANAGQVGSPNTATIVGDAALPSSEQVVAEARMERSRRDNVSAIRSLRRQF